MLGQAMMLWLERGGLLPAMSDDRERRHLIPAAALQLATTLLRRPPTPLLEEARHSGMKAGVADAGDPPDIKRPVPRPGFATSYNPVDAIQSEIVQWPKQWLARQKAHGRRH